MRYFVPPFPFYYRPLPSALTMPFLLLCLKYVYTCSRKYSFKYRFCMLGVMLYLSFSVSFKKINLFIFKFTYFLANGMISFFFIAE